MNLLWLTVFLGCLAFAHSWGLFAGASGGVAVQGSIGIGFMFGKRELAKNNKKMCARVCKPDGAGGLHCFFHCMKVLKGKNFDETSRGTRLQHLPMDFNSFALGEHSFDIKMFASVTGERNVDDGGLREAFKLADRDGDGQITDEEFKMAPWVKEGFEDNVIDNGNPKPVPAKLKEAAKEVAPLIAEDDDDGEDRSREDDRSREGSRSREDSREQNDDRRELLELVRKLRGMVRK